MTCNPDVTNMKHSYMKPILPRWLEKLEAKVLKDWGKPCKDYEPFCSVCRVWEAIYILQDLYSKGCSPTQPTISQQITEIWEKGLGNINWKETKNKFDKGIKTLKRVLK